MRPTSPSKLLLIGACVLPGTAVLASGFLRQPSAPPHHHDWGPCRPPGGTLRLVDGRSRPLSQLRPGQIARIECLPESNVDRCRRPDPGCEFAPEATVMESEPSHVVGFQDGGAGGEFGTLDTDGRFRPLPLAGLSRATHYRASGGRWGTFGFTALLDDSARTLSPSDHWIPTYDDPPAECAPFWILIGPDRGKGTTRTSHLALPPP
jgi:hypothetical protein